LSRRGKNTCEFEYFKVSAMITVTFPSLTLKFLNEVGFCGDKPGRSRFGLASSNHSADLADKEIYVSHQFTHR